MAEKIRFPGDEDVLGYLARQTEEHYLKQRARGTSTAPPPNRAQFDILLRACFGASLEQEEGRPVEFTLFFDAEALYADYFFETRPELSPHTLARLSAALHSERSYLCVAPHQDTLNVVGIRHWGDHTSFTPAGGNPSHVVIRVAGPGILVVRYDTSIILTYRRGGVARYPNDHSAHNDAVSALLPEGLGIAPERFGKLRDSVVYLAESMLRLKHGGTLLLVPESSQWKARVTAAPFAANDPATRVRDALISAALGRRDRSRPRTERARRLQLADFGSDDLDVQLGIELEWLAQLTATDGMTVITPDLTVLGFGVFFETSQAGVSTRAIDPYAAKDASAIVRPVAALGGARHQSAAITCQALPGAAAFVASQDGSLAAMRLGDDGHVIVHKHLELLLHA